MTRVLVALGVLISLIATPALAVTYNYSSDTLGPLTGSEVTFSFVAPLDGYRFRAGFNGGVEEIRFYRTYVVDYESGTKSFEAGCIATPTSDCIGAIPGTYYSLWMLPLLNNEDTWYIGEITKLQLADMPTWCLGCENPQAIQHPYIDTFTVRLKSAGDHGFNIYVTGSIPEPETWGLMSIGFGVTGLALRRRRPSILNI